jgi:UDP-N-acetyl-2-amino-2-deoxyglucuronate dehydrogenase
MTADTSEPIGWGIIGCGVIAPFHARAVAAVAGARLVAVVDEVPERAAAAGAEFGVEAMTDLDAFLARPDIQAVSICVPSGLHAAIGARAAEAGKHVLCEKPIDITLPAADHLIATCRARGVKLGVISQNRFSPAMVQVREALAAGRFGRLLFGGAYIPWYRTQGYYDSGAWRGTWALDGGGCLMNQGIHYIDLLQWTMGPVERVVARAATVAHQIEVEDVALAILQFQNGALGLIQGSTAIYPGLPERLEIAGEGGTAVVTAGKLSVWEFKDEKGEVGAYGAKVSADSAVTATGAADPAAISGSTHAAQVADLVAAIREDRDPAITGEAARRPLELILAIYQSAREGREVSLPLKA